MQNQNLVLVVYKGKILLVSLDSPLEKSEWSLIGETGRWSNSPNESVVKIVNKITKLNLNSIERISLSDSDSDYVFYAKLTDSNVNSIVRKTGLKLEFYNIDEVEKLNLSIPTDKIVSKFKEKIGRLLEV